MGKTKERLPEVRIYTDGACAQNSTQRGGYGTILLFGNKRKELSAGYFATTNNRMELLAVISGLEALTRPCAVTVHSDSRYVVDSVMKGWLKGWVKKGWKTTTGDVKNQDLWERFIKISNIHEVTLVWVKGHADNPLNNRCDELAVNAGRRPELELLHDEFYEKNVLKQETGDE